MARLVAKDEAFETITKTYNFKRESFKLFLDSLSENDYVLVENTFNAFWFYDQIAERVKECLVYNTNEARSRGNKTDKIDSRHLVQKLRLTL